MYTGHTTIQRQRFKGTAIPCRLSADQIYAFGSNKCTKTVGRWNQRLKPASPIQDPGPPAVQQRAPSAEGRVLTGLRIHRKLHRDVHGAEHVVLARTLVAMDRHDSLPCGKNGELEVSEILGAKKGACQTEPPFQPCNKRGFLFNFLLKSQRFQKPFPIFAITTPFPTGPHGVGQNPRDPILVGR